MQNINIGKSGIQVPFLGMGTWAIGGGAWWGDNDDALSVKAIQTAVEQGIQWIDTAPIYGLYHSETVVGEAMKHIDRRQIQTIFHYRQKKPSQRTGPVWQPVRKLSQCN